ncbi:MAG: putative membrane protein [Spirosomataceae bacterium]|jgi:uncharacterized membrane protein
MNLFSYFSVIGVSSLKFLLGPITGLAVGLEWYETYACTVLGMMLTNVVIMTLSGFLKKTASLFFKNKKKREVFTKTNRFAIKVRQRVGLWGIAFLTPAIFTPPIGVILAVAFRYDRKEIFTKMLVSAIVWGLVMVFFFYYLKAVLNF